MDFTTDTTGQADALVALFTDTFTASEGAEEGALIGALVRDQLETLAPEDRLVCLALEDGQLAGAIVFTPLVYAEDPRRVALLSPAAVATARQGQGVGQALIRFGLDTLRQAGWDIAVTYGDPGFYGKVGFAPVDEATLPAPHPLQFPEGWIAQSLTDAPLTPLKGPSRCVPPLDKPDLW